MQHCFCNNLTFYSVYHDRVLNHLTIHLIFGAKTHLTIYLTFHVDDSLNILIIIDFSCNDSFDNPFNVSCNDSFENPLLILMFHVMINLTVHSVMFHAMFT